MRIIVHNTRCSITEFPPAPYDKALIKEFTRKSANSFWAARQRAGWSGATHFISAKKGMFSSGLLPLILAWAKKHEIDVELDDQRQIPKGTPKLVNQLAKYTLRDYQEEAVKAALKEHRGIIKVPTGGGKCHGLGTKVLMYDGTIKNVEDVIVGDQLMGDDSTPRNVLSLARGREQMYRINQKNGDPYVVNESHILSLKKTCERKDGPKGDIVDIPLRDYMMKNKYFHHVHKGFKVACDFEQHNELDVDPWFLGLWLGDGFSATQEIAVHKSETEILHAIQQYAESIKGTFIYREPQNRCGIANITGSNLIDKLRKLNVKDNKHIPHQYKTASSAARLELLAGLIDSDGHYDGKGYEITLKNDTLANDVVFVARSLGFRTTVRKVKKSIKSIGFIDYYNRINFYGNTDKIPTKVSRKKSNERRINKDPLVHAISVEKLGIDEYYGFELDGNHRYLLGDFTVTHNTLIAASIIQSIKLDTLFIVERINLATQTKQRWVEEYGLDENDIGIVGGGLEEIDKKVVITTIQSVHKITDLERFDCMILDEMHHAKAQSYISFLKNMDKCYYRFGLSGTPFGGDPVEDMYRVTQFGPIIYELKTQTLIDEGVLSKPTIRMIEISKPNVDYMSPYLAQYKEAVANNRYRNYIICKFARELKGKTLILFKLIEHGTNLREKLPQALYIDGNTPAQTRDFMLGEFYHMDNGVMLASTVVDEGIDFSSIDSLIISAGEKSYIKTIQRLGRGLRASSTSNTVNVIDFYDDTCSTLLKHSRKRMKTYKDEGYVVKLFKLSEDIDDTTDN